MKISDVKKADNLIAQRFLAKKMYDQLASGENITVRVGEMALHLTRAKQDALRHQMMDEATNSIEQIDRELTAMGIED